jgi:hypothetical protein
MYFVFKITNIGVYLIEVLQIFVKLLEFSRGLRAWGLGVSDCDSMGVKSSAGSFGGSPKKFVIESKSGNPKSNKNPIISVPNNLIEIKKFTRRKVAFKTNRISYFI